MQISDAQVKMVRELLVQRGLIREIQDMDLNPASYPRPEDAELVRQVVQEVLNMPDREDRIAELKARVDAGTYNPSGDDIADAMIRRAIADRMG
ncbi:MAG: flagellar biosynthesis anti-sigma factor FlgM [Methanoregulaceae archaeon]|nr:flagellar biosynthesis anti-sigma factor FlgM [Methanoregulaceae archaeon]